MGMFNWIRNRIVLQCCGDINNGWQSKNIKIKSISGKTYSLDNSMQQVALEDICEGEIHNFCDKCCKMLEFNVSEGKLGLLKIEGPEKYE